MNILSMESILLQITSGINIEKNVVGNIEKNVVKNIEKNVVGRGGKTISILLTQPCCPDNIQYLSQ